ncbi:ABC transporter substrate-binding protein [Paenibacillus montanisoli]|uniref:ABC transporter substrate-binding protein n=2 Tax=Paenibacillus montanisoli TaxID=2081970 RepID=A0A328U4X3_9BACL|nr:ABC transporter substrate-binding protein [Paenibacillus montanisoli]
MFYWGEIMKFKPLLAMMTVLSLLASAVVPAAFGGHSVAAAEGNAAPDKEKSDNDDILGGLFGGDKGGISSGGGTTEDGGNGQAADEEEDSPVKRVVEDSYRDILKGWNDQGIKDAKSSDIVIHPDQFVTSAGQTALTTDSNGYDEPVFSWGDDIPSIELKVTAPQEGLYQIRIDYYSTSDKIIPVERAIEVNGKYPFFEARRVVLPKLWKDENEKFDRDALGNETPATQKQIKQWQTASLMDASYFSAEPLRFHLKQGLNSIKLTNLRESALIGKIVISPPAMLPSYEQYEKDHRLPKADETLIVVEAEHPQSKSEPSIRAIASGDANVIPHRDGKVTLNTLGGETVATSGNPEENEQSWQIPGQRATWKVKVDKAGSYQLAFKYKQNAKTSMPVYRTLMIDGKVPFKEANEYAFPYSNEWRNEVLTDKDGNPYMFALEEGEHEISLISDAAPYGGVVQTIRNVMWDINTLALEIKMATGNTMDVNRDWDITSQMPDLPKKLEGFADTIRKQYDELKALAGRNPDQASNFLVAAETLDNLAKEPEKIPYQFNRLSEGSGSVLQTLGVINAKLPNQPLQLDRFFVYSDSKLPSEKSSFFKSFWNSITAFFKSFSTDYSQVTADDKESLQIWVNRSRQNVMQMQQLVNSEFTKKTGIKVTLSIMPDEGKLVLASAAGNAPDAALGVSNYIPFRLAARGALADMNQFQGYDDVKKRFSPGALVPVTFNDKVYALPETQSFWVLFYRKDILDALNIPVPDTMEEVKQILPELQRFGMNFYLPLSATGGFKPYNNTIPFIYQHGGKLYTDDGTRTAIDQDEALAGLKQMTDMFTVYSVPLQVPSFYNQFRDGSLPIGIADAGTYIQLTAAAPELAGWWKIAPYPGVKGKDGVVNRTAPGTGATAIMFNSSKKKDDTWKFIEWWTSEEAQVRFGNDLEAIYGPTYKWNTANLAAFNQLSWPKEDIEVIQEQWKWLWDIPRFFGDYMVEREISDAWNKVVFDGFNARRAMEDAVINGNREIKKQLTDFGYMKNGKVTKPLTVPIMPKMSEMAKEGEQK